MNTPQDDTRFERGLALLREIELDLGNEHGLLHGMRVHAPRFKRRTIEMFGDFYAGEQTVDLKTKLLLAVAHASHQASDEGLLEFHIGAALKAGWSQVQVVEVLELAAAFAGWQTAIRAVQIAVRTFEKCASAEKK
ncbi:carboxymuconolactone decarboxylase family protein [Caldimonas brevitalea]|uniref:4-carboxymuconolactone decarboxylase n=1 Tax=Caldimonas brevitalea TaxID=413882 RepID=A0A0G3BSG7_9BURK|nr:carboxymuconolactone decarboxylase family protein [Caldimonas brevitalea]AKJ30948.1 4-carboxymuconolactone decarboxylase [Caldimonas brevitalea]